MDAMNDRVRPPSPVLGGPKAMLIPGGSFEQCVVIRQPLQLELALLRNQISMQMFRQDPGVKTPLPHWRRIRGDTEPKQPWLVPNFDRLNERAGREFAISYCAWSGSFNPGPLGIGKSGTKEPLLRLRQFWETHHVSPDLFRRSRNLDCAVHREHLRRSFYIPCNASG